MPNWLHVLKEIRKETDEPAGGESAADKVRTRYLNKLHNQEGRNVIGYYSGYLSKPRFEGSDISDEDKNGFMLCVDGLDRKKGLDLLIHTQGGDGAATESLVHYLREMFGKDVRAFVPQIAMSAGTIIALSCKEIYMGKHSNLGPVDPQVNGLPAYGVLAEVERAYKEMSEEQSRYYVWNPILSAYNPSFLQRCHWAKEAAHEMVTGFLKSNMFSGIDDEAERDERANKVFAYLAELSSNKGHDKRLHYKECLEIGLNIKLLEDKDRKALQDLILTIHHCYMFTFSNTGALKIIENHAGQRWVKVLQTVQPQMQLSLPQDMIDALNAEMLAKRGPSH
jgi:hypothetical protein